MGNSIKIKSGTGGSSSTDGFTLSDTRLGYSYILAFIEVTQANGSIRGSGILWAKPGDPAPTVRTIIQDGEDGRLHAGIANQNPPYGDRTYAYATFATDTINVIAFVM